MVATIEKNNINKISLSLVIIIGSLFGPPFFWKPPHQYWHTVKMHEASSFEAPLTESALEKSNSNLLRPYIYFMSKISQVPKEHCNLEETWGSKHRLVSPCSCQVNFQIFLRKAQGWAKAQKQDQKWQLNSQTLNMSQELLSNHSRTFFEWQRSIASSSPFWTLRATQVSHRTWRWRLRTACRDNLRPVKNPRSVAIQLSSPSAPGSSFSNQCPCGPSRLWEFWLQNPLLFRYVSSGGVSQKKREPCPKGTNDPLIHLWFNRPSNSLPTDSYQWIFNKRMSDLDAPSCCWHSHHRWHGHPGPGIFNPKVNCIWGTSKNHTNLNVPFLFSSWYQNINEK